jgi:type I restriction enzyme S subunit
MKTKKCKIKNIGSVISGGTPSTAKKEYWDGDISWITPKDLSSFNDRYISKGERFITKDGLNNSNAKLVPKHTILLTSRAPIGYLAIAKNQLSTNQGFKSVICNKLCYYMYFYYWLKNNMDIIKNNANGSTFQEISANTFKNLDINLPEVNIQEKIASILSNIDNKIELNSKINQNLEKYLKNLFNNWFVDLKHFKNEEIIETKLGKMLQNWEIQELKDFAYEIVCGKTPSTKKTENYGDKIPFITILDMHNQVFIINTERSLSEEGSNSQIKKLLPKNAVCVSCIATAGLVSITTKESHTNQQINTIICSNENQYFLYLKMLTLSNYIQMLGSSGSTTCNLNKQQFSKIKIIVPSENTIKNFTKIVKPFFNKIKENYIENEKLSNLRDILLPKLMSGEIDVSKVEI